MSDEEGDVLSVMLQDDGKRKSQSSISSSNSRKYGDEWNELCSLAERGLDHVRRHVVLMELEGSRFRSIYWQLLLGSLPCTPSLWISILRQQRNSYRLLHQRLTVDPHQASFDDDPLSQSSSSVWHQYFCDKELRALIRQDVVRTFPNMDFFRSESIHLTMVNILFCYGREHPEICYRQGMHEVLAPLLYVMHDDEKSLVRAKELAHISDQAAEILDPAWLEEDAYWLFCKLMSHLAGNYRVKNVTPLQTGYFPSSISLLNRYPNGIAESELATRITHIRDELLPRFDKELFQHLKSLDIPFQTFGIRWLRLLFGQEFPLPDLVYIWDAVFAEGDGLVNYIVVSMLSAIRDQLIIEDDTECLMLLMRYPPGVNVKTVIENALHMWNPKKFASSHEKGEKKLIVETAVEQKKVTSSQPSSLSGRIKKLSLWSQKKHATSGLQTQMHSSLPSGTSVEKSAFSNDRFEVPHSVVEGYTLNDPTIARAEVQHLLYIMSLVHSHLERHLAILEHTLPSNTPPAGKAALVGLKQISIQLGRSLPTAPKSLEVEAASEAQPALRAGTTNEVRNSSSEPSTKQHDSGFPLNDLKIYEGPELLSYFPMKNPLRCLGFCSSNRIISMHVSYCRVLGTLMI